MALTFFKTPKNKKYNYKPVYYDQKKEERDERLKSVGDEKDGSLDEDALRRRMQSRWKRTSGARDKKASNTRLIVIILVLVLIAYWIFLR